MQASQTRQGDYSVNYNAFVSTNLTPEIAQRVGVNRAGNQGVLLVNVRRDARDMPLGKPVPAAVSGRVRDLLGNSRPLKFREIREAGVIDYIAQFPIRNDDPLIFDLEAQPEGFMPIQLQFRRALIAEN